MSTLHNIYQINPLMINGGAFIKVKTAFEKDFDKQYISYLEQHFLNSPLPHHTSLQIATTHLKLTGLYVYDQLIPVENAGCYLFVESGESYGYEQDFIKFLEHFGSCFEDVLFYIVWDNLVDEFKIDNGVLTYHRGKDSNYDFVSYFEKKHPAQTAWLHALYINEAKELKMAHERMLANGESTKDWFDRDEYEDAVVLLDKTLKINPNDEIVVELKKWMKEQL